MPTDAVTPSEENPPSLLSQPASPDSGIDAKEAVGEDVDSPAQQQTGGQVISIPGEQRLEDPMEGKVRMGEI